MKKVHVVIFLFLIPTIFGCKKEWLEIKQDKSQVIPENYNDLQALLSNYLRMNRYANPLGEIASDGHYISEANWNSSTSSLSKNAYTWTKNLPNVNLFSWDMMYSGVLHCNIALDGLSRLSPSNPDEQVLWNNIKGQALFYRAYNFHYLSQIYAEPFEEETADTDMGIPMRLSTDVTKPSFRSSVRQVYHQIVTDLEEASELLPAVTTFKSRPSQAAVFALLARVYLSMRKYDDALRFAAKCLQLHNELLDYNLLPTDVSFVGTYIPTSVTPPNIEVIFHHSMDEFSFLTTRCLIDTALYNLYDTNDLRRRIFFMANSNGSIIFKGNYNNNTSEMFDGLATDEVMLIHAECSARKGDKDVALANLNALLISRWANNNTWMPLTESDPDKLIEIILVERRKELLLRGIRWSDLRRLNKEDRYRITLSRTIGGQTYTLEPNSFKYTFPLPDDVIEISGMPQSPGW